MTDETQKIDTKFPKALPKMKTRYSEQQGWPNLQVASANGEVRRVRSF